jgi:hypothetical protein
MEYLSTSQAAEELSVSRQTILNWHRWGILRGIWVKKNPLSGGQGRLYIERESINEALRSGKI